MSYKLPVADTLAEAWNKVAGTKATFWGAFIVLLAIGFAVGIIFAITDAVLPKASGIVQFIGQIFLAFLQAGLLYIGIQRALEKPITYTQVFTAFHKPYFWRYILLYILQILCYFIPIAVLLASQLIPNHALSVIIGIIGFVGLIAVAIRIYIALGFLLEDKLAPMQAIKASFHATRGNVCRIFLVGLAQGIIIVISIIPFGIGLIWTLPFSVVLFGVIYKRLRENATLSNPV